MTNLLSILRILTEVLSRAHAKRGKGLINFKFGTFIDRFPSDAATSMAVKGLTKRFLSLMIDGGKNGFMTEHFGSSPSLQQTTVCVKRRERKKSLALHIAEWQDAAEWQDSAFTILTSDPGLTTDCMHTLLLQHGCQQFTTHFVPKFKKKRSWGCWLFSSCCNRINAFAWSWKGVTNKNARYKNFRLCPLQMMADKMFTFAHFDSQKMFISAHYIYND